MAANDHPRPTRIRTRPPRIRVGKRFGGWWATCPECAWIAGPSEELADAHDDAAAHICPNRKRPRMRPEDALAEAEWIMQGCTPEVIAERVGYRSVAGLEQALYRYARRAADPAITERVVSMVARLHPEAIYDKGANQYTTGSWRVA